MEAGTKVSGQSGTRKRCEAGVGLVVSEHHVVEGAGMKLMENGSRKSKS